MRKELTVEELKQREVLTPGQARRVWGRSHGFYAGAFYRGDIKGYDEPRGDEEKKVWSIYLFADSIRAYLHTLAEGTRQRRGARRGDGWDEYNRAIAKQFPEAVGAAPTQNTEDDS